MNEVKTIITSDPTGEMLVKFSGATAERLVRDQLKRTQIRKIFTEVRKIQAQWDKDDVTALRRLNMLQPKLDYQSKRAEKKGISPLAYLKTVLTDAIVEVNAGSDASEKKRRFDKFVELFEAILAYHRARGGEE